MAKFLTTNGTSYEIEQLMIEATKELVLISPFLQISKTFFERLQDATQRGVKVTIIFGKDKLNKNEEQQIKKLCNIELYFFDNLHAKCYFSEQKMVITSMNMYEFSEKNNREMGVLIDSKMDFKVYKQAVEESKSIINNSKLHFKSEGTQSVNKDDARNARINHYKNNIAKQIPKGVCIRCKKEISWNPHQPYCTDCYKTWSQFANTNYTENVCHGCAKPMETSMSRPLCQGCFDKLSWEQKCSLMTSNTSSF